MPRKGTASCDHCDVEETLNERFGAADGGPIDCHGQTVHSALELPLAEPLNLWLRFLSSDPRAGAQSIAISLRRKGRKRLGIVYEGVAGRKWRFWTDSEHQHPGPIICMPPSGGTELLVFNGWLGEDGEPEEWLSNHGIVVEQQDERRWLLHCSRGGRADRPPSFEDLLAEVRIEPADPDTAREALRAAQRVPGLP